MGFLQEHRDRLKAFLDKLTNDAHVPIALFVFIVTTVYVWHTGKDLPPGFVSSLYAFYGFLGGHALVYQKWPDPTASAAPTVDVNVNNTTDNTNTNTNSASASAGTGSGDAKG